MEHEMNFFDLCVACCRAIGRGFAALGRLVGRMTRLTYRYWWIVLPFVALALTAAFYYTRSDNRSYKVNAIAFLNGPTITQFEQTYATIQSGMVDPNAALYEYSHSLTATHFTYYRVIDCLNDESADYVDFKRKSTATDTVKMQMPDRVCLQFRVKSRNIHLIPQIENTLLEYLNSDQAMQQAYKAYLPNLQEKVAFNHRQAQKLDSLTSCYYFSNASNAQPFDGNANGVNFYGDRRVRLFLKDIYKQQKHLQNDDYRLQYAYAPVVLENHFATDGRIVNGRLKYLIICFLFGWSCGCILAGLIDRRKQILAWLKE